MHVLLAVVRASLTGAPALQEPLRIDSPLRGMPNVLLAPHNANASPTAHERVHWNTLKNLLTQLRVPFEQQNVDTSSDAAC